MKALTLAGLVLFATPSFALAAGVPVTLDATPLTLSRTSLASVEVSLINGTELVTEFTQADIQAGVAEKFINVASLADIATCKASWHFSPHASDIVPAGGASVDNLDFDCRFQESRDAIEITPLTMVQPLKISIPTAAFAARDATSVFYSLQVFQQHGPTWTYSATNQNVFPNETGDAIAEYVIFTGGCLSFKLAAWWQRNNGVLAESDRNFIGESYVVE